MIGVSENGLRPHPQGSEPENTRAGTVSSIVQGSIAKIGFKVDSLPEGWSALDKLELITVDTGACDAISPPTVFSNTGPRGTQSAVSSMKLAAVRLSPIWVLKMLSVYSIVEFIRQFRFK